MMFSSWLRNWKRSLDRRWALYQTLRRKTVARCLVTRPILEVLEDRTLPSVSVLGQYTGISNATEATAPPDTQVGAGPNSVVEVVNNRINIYTSKATGSNPVTDNLGDFFFTKGNLKHPTVSTGDHDSLADSGVLYDPVIQRFIVDDIDAEFDSGNNPVSNGSNALVLAVSRSNNPTTPTTSDWYFYEVSTSETGIALQDYPGNLGYNGAALVCTLNSFANGATRSSGTVTHVLVNAFSLSALTSNSTLTKGTNYFQTDATNVNLGTTNAAISLRPTAMQDSTLSTDPMWLVEEGGDNQSINVIQMSSVLSSTPTFTSTNIGASQGVNPYYQATAELQPDDSAIEGGASKIMNAMEMNDELVAAQSVSDKAGDLDQIQWYQFSLYGTPILAQEGDVSGGIGTYYAYPGIAENSQGDIGMSYTSSGTGAGQYMSVYAIGNTPSDNGTMEAPVLIQAGDGLNGDGREGDMSGIGVDTSGNFWIANEYALSGSWGTAIAHITLNSPIYYVRSTADSGSATLRDAINQVNLGNYNEIDFAIGDTGSTQTISPLSPLPALTANGVYVNGLSQGGNGNTTPLITLNGSALGVFGEGLVVQGSRCNVAALLINQFGYAGIEVDGSNNTIGGQATGFGNVISGNGFFGVYLYSSAKNNFVEGNFIGTNAAGTSAWANGNGVVDDGSSNYIGGFYAGQGNVISGNTGDGVYLENASGDVVAGNHIGTNASGTAALANSIGVEVGASNNFIGYYYNPITFPDAGNFISGNTSDGVLIDSGVTGVQVLSNWIGINGAGTAALANGYGVVDQGSNNIIGAGTGGNVISGNNSDGVYLNGASNDLVLLNLIGTNVAGTAAITNEYGVEVNGSNNTLDANVLSGNFGAGALIDSGGTGNQVLGNSIGLNGAGNGALANGIGIYVFGTNNTLGLSGAGNYISGNSLDGAFIDASGVTVQGNYIGTDTTGTVAVGNKYGVVVAASGNTIGSTTNGAGNVISGNSTDGVYIGVGGVAVQGNSIGTNAAGTSAVANSNGVEVAASNNTIGVTTGRGNIISGNIGDGVSINSGVTGVLVVGDFIGTDATGSAAVGNGKGVEVNGSNNTIGATSGYVNVISGNSGDGILIDTGVTGVQVVGNSIGTNVAGTAAVGNGTGVDVYASNNTIGGTVAGARNIISGSGNGAGVVIEIGVTGVAVQGNFIGTNASGSGALGNNFGVAVDGPYDTIGGTTAGAGNVISGNSIDGVFLANPASGVQVQGNYIGTNSAGSSAVSNVYGIEVEGSNNTLGGTASGAGNVISGNSGGGAVIDTRGVSGVAVQGNYIGTNASGSAAVANGFGVEDFGSNDTFGGTVTAARNVISGNNGDGVRIYSGASGVVVQGNFIGTDVSGGSALGNSIGVEVAASGNTIGGSASGAGNVISGNTNDGVLIDSNGSDNLVLGNFIGVDFSGTHSVGNASNGVEIAGSSNTIGSSASGGANVISGNSKNGVLVSAGSGDTNSRNSIFANTGLGISLASGANNNIVAPTISSASIIGYMLTVKGSLTAATANVSYVLEFFANSSSDAEGKTYLGSLTVTPTTVGTQSFTFNATTTVPRFYPLITATLTDNSGDTSQFSSGVSSTTSYVVSSTADSGTGTLRDAITQANNPANGITTIDFAIGAAGSSQTIKLASALPALTANNVFINGLSQGGLGNTTRRITLDGTSAGSSSDGLLLQGSSDVVSGLILEQFGANGVEVAGVSNTIGGTASGQGNVLSGNTADGLLIDATASGVQVQGNFIGTDVSGTKGLANSVGIGVAGNSNTIGGTTGGARNYISGNTHDGVLINGSASGVQVQGNYIGTDVTGTKALANSVGVEVDASVNTIGGTASGARNLLSGNSIYGVVIDANISGVQVQGNSIGTDTTGTKIEANNFGVYVLGSNNTVGGTTSAARNVISGSNDDGVFIGSGVSGVAVQGNYIGLNSGGSAALANSIGIEDAGSGNVLGGSVGGAGNYISGNSGDGVLLDSTAKAEAVQGNFIGLTGKGTAALANGSNGIEVKGVSNTIGGTSQFDRNYVSGNANDGVLIDSAASGNVVLGNFIGLDTSGTHGVGNVANGVEVAGSSNTIGGTDSGATNYESGNTKDGILLDSTASSNQVADNWVGTDKTGKVGVANSGNGVEIMGASNTLGGVAGYARNIVAGNSGDGVRIDSGASGTLVQGNYLGVNYSAAALSNGGNGVNIAGNSNTIGGSASGGRNIISGNSKDGVLISAGSGNLVQSNDIGTDATGSKGVGNVGNGVEILGNGNTLGGTSNAALNIIAGNSGDGVRINSGASGDVVLGNFIGVNASAAALANSGYGVDLFGTKDTIGGTVTGSRNIIAGNGSGGMVFQSTATANLAQSNFVGLNGPGSAVGNSGDGILFLGSNNTIGGTASAARNVISANSNDGVQFDSGASGNVVLGNYIGLSISGTAALGNSVGIEDASSGNTIGGSSGIDRNYISGNSKDGILLDSSAKGETIESNYIGLNGAGTGALGNSIGIEDASSGNTIGASISGAGNYISGNTGDGVLLDSGAKGEVVEDNFIGLTGKGTAALANGGNGIEIQGLNNTIGGTAQFDRNYLSGNSNDGVLIDSAASGNVLQNNFLGLDSSGTKGVGNVGNGVEVAGSSNTIGGTVSGATNIESGNSKDGVLLDSTASSNQVADNWVGTDKTGKVGVANSGNGVEIMGASNTLGGVAGYARNIVSGNSGDGVRLDSGASGTLVQGNYIGVNYSAAALGNSGNGVNVSSNNNTIGGTVGGASNVISGNSKLGVLVIAGSGTTISRNSIYANTGQGISLSSGANNNLVAPSLSSAVLSGSTLTVKGSFTAPTANVSYVLEFFANLSGDPEGRVYLGSMTVKPTSTGTMNFTYNTTNTSQLGTYPLIAATLTDNVGDTSAFSAGQTVTG